MKTGRLVVDVLREKHPDMRVPPVENPMCAAFEEYKEVRETVHLALSEDDVMWVAYKLSGAVGVLVAKVIELRNWLLCFGFALDKFRFVVTNLVDWMTNTPPPLGCLPCSDGMLPHCTG